MKQKSGLLESQLYELENNIKSEYKKRLKESVNNTVIFIDTLYEKYLTDQKKSGRPSSELTDGNRKEFLSKVRKYFYSNINDRTRYLWINEVRDFSGGDGYARRLIHPNLKETEGMLLSTKMEDIKGKRPYQEELEGVKQSGEIYFTYYFKKMDSEKITEKLSFAKLYKRLNWVVATGIPVDDLNRMIAEKKTRMEANFFENMVVTLLLKSVIVLIVILLLLKLSRHLERILIALQTSNASLLNAQKIAHFGSWELDMENNRLVWSDEVYRIFGLEPQSVDTTYETFLSIIHPDDKEAVKEAFAKSLKERTGYSIQHRIVRGDGSIGYVEEHGQHFFDKKGKTVKSIGTVYDISIDQEVKNKLQERVRKEVAKRLKIEEEKLKQERLLTQQAKMAEMGEMLGVIIHQWKQPLNAISLTAQNLEIINEDFFDETNEELKKIEDVIVSQVHFMSDTMSYFRNFFSPNSVDVKFYACEVIDEIRTMFSGAFEKKGIHIDVAEHEHFYTLGKKSEFSQVILNILNNAKDVYLTNGTGDKRVVCSFDKNDKYNIMKIRDNAGGIPEDLMPDKLFEAYVTTKGEKGTGIGLHISKMIIERNLKGKLWAHNVGDGAEFVIELPICEDEVHREV